MNSFVEFLDSVEPYVQRWFPLVLLIGIAEFAISLGLCWAEFAELFVALPVIIAIVVPLFSFLFALVANLLFTAFFGTFMPMMKESLGSLYIEPVVIPRLFGYGCLGMGAILVAKAPLVIILDQTVEGAGLAFLMMALAFRIKM